MTVIEIDFLSVPKGKINFVRAPRTNWLTVQAYFGRDTVMSCESLTMLALEALNHPGGVFSCVIVVCRVYQHLPLGTGVSGSIG